MSSLLVPFWDFQSIWYAINATSKLEDGISLSTAYAKAMANKNLFQLGRRKAEGEFCFWNFLYSSAAEYATY